MWRANEISARYDRQNQKRKYIQKIQLMASMGPPGGGRNTITNRLLAKFNVINMTFPAEKQIVRIYGTMLNQQLLDFHQEVKGLGKRSPPLPSFSPSLSLFLSFSASHFRSIYAAGQISSNRLFDTPSRTRERKNLYYMLEIHVFLLVFWRSHFPFLAATEITQATIAMYNSVVLHMLPTPMKMHYLFNLRDISKVGIDERSYEMI